MWEDNNYCWVVLCKNDWFHRRENLFSKHGIPLAETDVYTPAPALKNSFTVRCDECHKEYLYKPSDVLRHDQELPVSFIPHPLFQLDFMPRAVESTEQKAVEVAAEILSYCMDAGGSLTGEHGIGADKSQYMPTMFAPEDLALMQRVRAVFDRRGLCNPGKVFPTPRLCGEVPGPYRRHPIEEAGLAERL